MKKAFTMIELIFVIVILGILAAVAIPKLAATRTDAVISKTAQNIMTGVSEISGYAMSQANVNPDLSVMSNSIKAMVDAGEATITTATQKVDIQTDGSNCVTIQVDTNASAGTDTLKIDFITANTGNICVGLQGAINTSRYPMKLRGTNVTY